VVPVAAALAFGAPAAWRKGLMATGLAVLAIAPASWSVQTLGHATNGTFPAGGPASAAFGGGGPGGGSGGRGFANAGPPPGFGTGVNAMPGGGANAMQATPGSGAARGPGAGSAAGSATGGFPAAGSASGGPAFGGTGGGPFGGNTSGINAAVRYARAHGGGTIVVSSQSGAAMSIISSRADVAGIGGFSGRETQVTISWFAEAVRSGRIRWVIADSGGMGMRNDNRIGAGSVLAAVAQTCKPVTSSAGTLYDCRGYADALARLG
jgi:hypothetical protein